MEDSRITELFWERKEVAITEAQEKYSAYCLSVAMRILGNGQDSEEVVNDAFLAAWNSIPPQRPENLSTYLAKLTRRIAVDRLRLRKAKKRGRGETELALEELEEILPAQGDPAAEAEARELEVSVQRFIASLPDSDRDLFLARYWHLHSIEELAKALNIRKGTVKTRLFRLREKLKDRLREEGYIQ